MSKTVYLIPLVLIALLFSCNNDNNRTIVDTQSETTGNSIPPKDGEELFRYDAETEVPL